MFTKVSAAVAAALALACAPAYAGACEPWVTFNADGSKAFFMALVFNQSSSLENGMTVSRSVDGGANWGTPKVLKYDANFHILNDKNSITGDRFDASNVYAIW